MSRVRHVTLRTNTKAVARPKGESNDEEREPKTPFARVTKAPRHPVVAPYVAPVRLARTIHASKGRTSAAGAPAAAPSDFVVNAATDLGCAGTNPTRGCPGADPKFWDYSLVNEPSVGSNGSSILETWNWHTAYSTNGGASFNYLDPYSAFPDAFGHFCCDQLAYYDASRDLFIWVLQYSPDAAGHNVIRLAVANGAAGLAANSWYYWDFSAGTSYWFDQPKIATSANDAYLEISKYGSSSNSWSGSVMIRFPLDQLKAHTPALTTATYSDPQGFSPAPVQRAGNTMYFATRVPFASDSTHLRVYSWPEAAASATYNDVTISADPPFPNTTGYSCPKSGQAADTPSDWCPRKSSTGGYAHDQRINSGFLSNGTIVFSWDAPQGTASGGVSPGTFPYPYTHVVRINEATKALIDQPIAWSPNYAIQWSSLVSNANGDIAGIVQYGGGAEHENCGALIHDGFVSGGFWEFHNLVSSDSDTADTKSGDYTATRGIGNSWIGACYVLRGGGSTGYVHPHYVSFGRAGTPPPPVTQYALGVTKSGDGSGTVTSSPAGIDCGATCSANFNTATVVTLTASNPRQHVRRLVGRRLQRHRRLHGDHERGADGQRAVQQDRGSADDPVRHCRSRQDDQAEEGRQEGGVGPKREIQDRRSGQDEEGQLPSHLRGCKQEDQGQVQEHDLVERHAQAGQVLLQERRAQEAQGQLQGQVTARATAVKLARECRITR